MGKPRLLALLSGCLLLAGLWNGLPGARAGSPGPASQLAPSLNVQRTLRLLASSRPGQRNTVRILLYGQSITEQAWSQHLERDLRRRYPYAHLVFENRALGGFPSQLLVKTAETDLYPFYPDLLVFHVYGAHDAYEQIVQRVRERTTSEILLQTDHVIKAAELHEETDPARLPLGQSDWGAFFNHNFLPSLARRYGTALCDQRSIWKSYLRELGLSPDALLRDGAHLNGRGENLMAECVEACLRRAPWLGRAAAEAWVTTHRNIRFQGGFLRFSFSGNRLDALLAPGAGAASVLIDGRKPSEWPELYGFTRALGEPGGKWPLILQLRSQAPLVLERWTLEVTTESRDPERYRFALRGSVTGPDGEGSSERAFVSRSGRIVIAPEDWGVGYALQLAGVEQIPERFQIAWDVVPRFSDTLVGAPFPGRGLESAVTLAQGLPNGPHLLELSGQDVPLRALRVYRPPLASRSAPAANGRATPPQSDSDIPN